ncbi:MAG: hypothetical protein H7263_10940, partial [Candidatus Sericytochromatia bacterium]|nr:hypothetical protein [Candidatus Sericytochromatia bacterium]
MSGVNRVGGLEPKKGGNATNGVAAPLVIRGKGASKVEQNDNSIKVDSMLQKVEKHGKISLKEFTKMAGLVDGGKQALGKYLLTKGIVPANTISKLMQKDTNFSDRFNTAASSKSVGLKSICAKLTVLCTGGLVLAATNLGKNNFEAKVDKVELKHVRTKEGSTQLISDMKKLTSPSSLRDYVKNNDVSAQQYDAISKHIPFKVQSQMDVSSMTETLKHQDPAKAKTLSKIFFAMQQGQMSMRKEGTTDTQPWPHDMASALSHGGRVCMVLDK